MSCLSMRCLILSMLYFYHMLCQIIQRYIFYLITLRLEYDFIAEQ